VEERECGQDDDRKMASMRELEKGTGDMISVGGMEEDSHGKKGEDEERSRKKRSREKQKEGEQKERREEERKGEERCGHRVSSYL
jgi:hypothetical protein